MSDARRDAPWTFFLFTLAWTWALVAPVVFTWHGRDVGDAPAWALALVLLGSYGPSLIALALTWHSSGAAGVKSLLGAFGRWRVGLRWYAVVLLAPAAFTLLAMAIHAGLYGVDWTWDGGDLPLLPFAILAAMPFGPLGEELGWRGYALPRLLRRYGGLTASLLLGAVWTAWHAPMFWAPAGTSISGVPVTAARVAGYLLLLTGYSVLYTWVYGRTRGSLLLAFLFHTGFNIPVIALTTAEMPAEVAVRIELLSAIPLWIVAAIVVASLGTRLGRPPAEPRSGA